MLSVQSASRLEVWSTLQCRAGARLAVVPEVQSCVASVSLAGPDRLTVVLPHSDRNADAMATLAVRRVLRVRESDSVFDEWRIVEMTDDASGGARTILCEPADFDLAAATLVGQTDADGVTRYDFEIVGLTPTEILDTYVLPALAAAGLTWVARGTVDPTTPLDLTVSWDTPLALARAIAEKAAAELQVRRNGTTGYYLDLVTAIGASAGTADVRYRKNLREHRLVQGAAGQATRLFPRGMQLDGYHTTLAGARWGVLSVDTGTGIVGLVDPVGGAAPAQFADQFNGLYLRKPDGTRTQITDTVVQAFDETRLTLASAAGLVVGDFVEIVADSAGAALTAIESPADVAAYGVLAGILDLPDVPPTVNVIPNPVGREWPSGTLPDGWGVVTSAGTPTTAKETGAAYTKLGGASVKVTATASGQGVRAPFGVVRPSALKPYGSGFARVLVSSGQVRVELVVRKADNSTVTLPTSGVASSSGPLGVWSDLGVSGEDLNALGAKAVAVRVLAHGGAATFYVDGVQATESAAQEPFVEGSGAVQLWQAANEKLRTNAGPTTTFDVALVDLYRLDGTTWDDTKVALGAGVRVTDPRLSVAVSTRIVGVERDYSVPGNTRLTLSTRPEDLTGALARPARPGRRTGSTPDLVPPGDSDPASPPVATITTVSSTNTSVTAEMSATLGANGVGPLQYRYRTIDGGFELGPEDGWTAWLAASGLPDQEVITRLSNNTRTLELQVRDTGASNITGDASLLVEQSW